MKATILTVNGEVFVEMNDLAHWLADILLESSELDVGTVRVIRKEILRVSDRYSGR